MKKDDITLVQPIYNFAYDGRIINIADDIRIRRYNDNEIEKLKKLLHDDTNMKFVIESSNKRGDSIGVIHALNILKYGFLKLPYLFKPKTNEYLYTLYQPGKSYSEYSYQLLKTEINELKKLFNICSLSGNKKNT